MLKENKNKNKASQPRILCPENKSSKSGGEILSQTHKNGGNSFLVDVLYRAF